MALELGEVVGNYIIEEKIGEGGMATIYRVRHSSLGTIHALKVLNEEFRSSADIRARFLTEGLIGAKLKHPNIVPVTDTVSTLEVAGLVMEFVKGKNLAEFVESLRGPPHLAVVIAIFTPILSAVGEAHRQGIIHRDIKPANVLLEERPGNYVPRLTDFGIAKVLGSGAVPKKNWTIHGQKMGTHSYMSPEQIKNPKAVDRRSDIFSLGATLYELATTTTAFDGDTDFDIMSAVVGGQYRRPENIDSVSPVIAAAINRALQIDPANRFASCEEFLAALEAPPPEPPRRPTPVPEPARVRTPPHQPASPRPPSPPRAPKKTSSLGTLVGILFVALMVGGGFKLLSTHTTPPIPSSPPSPPPVAAELEAVQAYRRFIAAYNAFDADRYYGTLSDPIECFYNARNYPVATLRSSRRNQRFEAGAGPAYIIVSISVVDDRGSSVAFWDQGQKTRRLIVMKNMAGEWKLTTEVDAGTHRCADKYF